MSQVAEIRKLTDAEIRQSIDDSKEEMFNLRFQWEIGQLEDITRIPQLKKQIARLKTVQRERELAAALIREESHAE